MRVVLVSVFFVSACRPDEVDPPTTDDPVDTQLEVLAVGPNGLRLSVEHSEPATPTVACKLDAAPPVWRQLVPFGAEWAYRAGEDLPDLSWIEPSFDASGWSRKDLPIGYGQRSRSYIDPQTTNLWLRTTFQVDDPSAVEEAYAMYRRDDGVAVWINGTRVLSDNVPDGAIDANTQALSTAEDDAQTELHEAVIPVETLVAGENVLAVALVDDSSFTDAGFEMRLVASVLEPADPLERHVVQAAEAQKSHEITVRGLIAEATYTCTVTAGSGEVLASETIETVALPAMPPALARAPGSASDRAYTLFNHQRPCVQEYVNRLYIVDPDGRVRWSYDTPVDGISTIDIEATLLDSDRVLVGGGLRPRGRPRIIGLDGNDLHVADFPGVEDGLFHHSVMMDGTDILGMMQTELVGSKGVAEGFSLVAYDPGTQEVSWQWDSQTALDAGQLPDPGDESNPYHANAAWPADDSAVYVSLFKLESVIRIDRASGNIDWWLGLGGDFDLVDEAGDPLPDEDWFDVTHGLKAYGPDRVWVYDNNHTDHKSEAIALRLDQEARTATVEWRWSEVGWNEPLWGDVDELPNGNAVITMAHAWCHGGGLDHPGAFVEIAPSTGDVVSRIDFLDPDDSTYRSQRIDGCAVFANEAMCPGVGSP